MTITSLAIITARGGSKRIPKKNIRPFCGKPIIAYSIAAARAAGCFDTVMVSTDCPEIAEIAQNYGAEVPFMRSTRTADDHATTAAVITEVLKCYQAEGQLPQLACCIYPTAPFVHAESLLAARAKLLAQPNLLTVFPVVKFAYPIQRALTLMDERLQLLHPENLNVRSQDLIPTFHDAGQFYWLRTGAFLNDPVLMTSTTGAIVLPEMLVQDIDNEEDWQLAEMKYQYWQQQLTSHQPVTTLA